MRAWGRVVGLFGDVLGALLALFRSLLPSVSLEFVSPDAALTAVRREAFAVAISIAMTPTTPTLNAFGRSLARGSGGGVCSVEVGAIRRPWGQRR